VYPEHRGNVRLQQVGNYGKDGQHGPAGNNGAARNEGYGFVPGKPGPADIGDDRAP
jgi:hypothetical protein